jgi:hypothetical protein
LGSSGGVFIISLSTGGGGRISRVLTPAVSLLAGLVITDPKVDAGGLLTDLLRKSSCGLWASVVGLGGGGGGRFPAGGPLLRFRPAWDWFKAAIRADNEVNCGSSTSVMVGNEREKKSI